MEQNGARGGEGGHEGTGETKPVAEGERTVRTVEHGIIRSENHRGTGQLDHCAPHF